MTDRAAALTAFLAANGWGAALRTPLAGDASARRYERLSQGDRRAVVMDSPPGQADDPADFVRIAWHLRGLGLSAPDILAADIPQGFLLLEDLGDDLFARVAVTSPALEAPIYSAATDVLALLQAAPPPPGLPDLSAEDWGNAAVLALDWYAFGATGTRPDATAFTAELTEALQRHADGPRVLILRDYHAENLLWLPGREGLARVGLLDFQLAQMGQPAYDLVSLVQDARRDVAPATASAVTRRFAEATGAEGLDTAIAVIGAQRGLRILGIFARLCVQAGKPGYLPLIPRVWGQVQANLAHPALARLRVVCEAVLPPPTPAILDRIAGRCAR
jgi:aminoglycoside/choline kinase family phosphotransferase